MQKEKRKNFQKQKKSFSSKEGIAFSEKVFRMNKRVI